MENKLQMTEEQARIHFQECNPYHINRKVLEDYYIERCKEKGYIRKSELQTIVDEAEEMYKNYYSHESQFTITQLVEELYQAIQKLKENHPEIKK